MRKALLFACLLALAFAPVAVWAHGKRAELKTPATTVVRGEILEITAVDTTIVWKLAGVPVPVVCIKPFTNPNGCGVQPISDLICGTAHVGYWGGGPYPAGPALFIHQLTPTDFCKE